MFKGYNEDALQIAVANYLNGLEVRDIIAWSHPPLGGKRSFKTAKKMKAFGAKAGDPDCFIYLDDPVTICIELKASWGTVSPDQKKRHAKLRGKKIPVYIVKTKTPAQAVSEVEKILRSHGVRV